MIAALADPATQHDAEALPFGQRLAMLVQRELDWRDGKRVARLMMAARLRVGSACVEDIDWRASRGLDRHLVTALTSGDWIRRRGQGGRTRHRRHQHRLRHRVAHPALTRRVDSPAGHVPR